MNLFVDTSVWSLALRRDRPSAAPEVGLLEACLTRGDLVVTTGLVLQELLQGFQGPSARKRIIKDFSLLPSVMPDTDDPTKHMMVQRDPKTGELAPQMRRGKKRYVERASDGTWKAA